MAPDEIAELRGALKALQDTRKRATLIAPSLLSNVLC